MRHTEVFIYGMLNALGLGMIVFAFHLDADTEKTRQRTECLQKTADDLRQFNANILAQRTVLDRAEHAKSMTADAGTAISLMVGDTVDFERPRNRVDTSKYVTSNAAPVAFVRYTNPKGPYEFECGEGTKAKADLDGGTHVILRCE